MGGRVWEGSRGRDAGTGGKWKQDKCKDGEVERRKSREGRSGREGGECGGERLWFGSTPGGSAVGREESEEVRL